MDLEAGGEQQDRQVLVDAADAGRVELEDVDGAGLEPLVAVGGVSAQHDVGGRGVGGGVHRVGAVQVARAADLAERTRKGQPA